MTRRARRSGRCVRSGRRGRAGRGARSGGGRVRLVAAAAATPGLARNAVIFPKVRGERGCFVSAEDGAGVGRWEGSAGSPGQPVPGSWEGLRGACVGAQARAGCPEQPAAGLPAPPCGFPSPCPPANFQDVLVI